MDDDAQIWIDLGAMLEADRQCSRSQRRLEKINLNMQCGYAKSDGYSLIEMTALGVCDFDRTNLNNMRQNFLKNYPGRAEILIASYIPEKVR